jgi:toxin ParE1/3/4
MSVLPFVISKEAINDLNEIWHYTAHKWSVEQANRYYDLIFEEIRYISKEPLSGRAINDIRQGYRVSKVKSHLIFYKPAIDRVEVVRILHQRMDIEGHLGIKE